jgi:hypothetical protein
LPSETWNGKSKVPRPDPNIERASNILDVLKRGRPGGSVVDESILVFVGNFLDNFMGADDDDSTLTYLMSTSGLSQSDQQAVKATGITWEVKNSIYIFIHFFF